MFWIEVVESQRRRGDQFGIIAIIDRKLTKGQSKRMCIGDKSNI